MNKKKQTRTAFFIDGFNLYHSLCTNEKNQYKWLNLRTLCEQFLLNKEIITDIFYFSALPTWNLEKQKRHKVYIEALESQDIKVLLGKFKRVSRNCFSKCSHTNKTFTTFEEKETDVNIALKLLEFSVTDKFDKAVIISGDSDLIPPVLKIKQLTPNKKTLCIVPKKGHDLMTTCHSGTRLKKKHLEKSLFPKIIKSNKRVIECPKEEWLPQ